MCYGSHQQRAVETSRTYCQDTLQLPLLVHMVAHFVQSSLPLHSQRRWESLMRITSWHNNKVSICMWACGCYVDGVIPCMMEKLIDRFFPQAFAAAEIYKPESPGSKRMKRLYWTASAKPTTSPSGAPSMIMRSSSKLMGLKVPRLQTGQRRWPLLGSGHQVCTQCSRLHGSL